jgi:hypothetical protein
MNNSENRVLVEYYQGACGPSLIVLLNSPQEGLQFKSIFSELAKGKVREAKFSQADFLRLENLLDVTLQVTAQAKEKKSLTRINDADEITFNWSQTQDGWMRSVGLLDGLITADTPGHQYLTSEAVDDALVEVSFMEDLRPMSGDASE